MLRFCRTLRGPTNIHQFLIPSILSGKAKLSMASCYFTFSELTLCTKNVPQGIDVVKGSEFFVLIICRAPYSDALLAPSGPPTPLWPLCVKGGCLCLAEMGSTLVYLANFSAHQAKLHSQGMPKSRQGGPGARQCTVLSLISMGEYGWVV